MLVRRMLVAGLAALGALLALAPGATAQVAVGQCEDRELRGAECGRIAVPLDHTNPAPPPQGRTVPLSYVRIAARGQRRGTVVFVAGGPGQAATTLAGSVARGPLRGLRNRYDLVFVDQRGSGASGPLRCSTAPRGTFRFAPDATQEQVSAAIARCSNELAGARPFYSTYETVLDLEDLRQFLRVPKIIPLGVSYGGQVAGEYARRYPDQVAALVLDSTSPIEGIDALGRLPQLALPRVLREVCFPPGCARVLGDPQALLTRAVARLSRGPLRGRVVLPSGRTRTAAVTLLDVYRLVLSSDQDPALRTALPAAFEAAGRGDAAPLLRLVFRSRGSGGETGAVNEVRFLATACTEGRLPWAPESPQADRPALLERALRENAQAYAPFPVETVATEVTAALCLGWAPTERPPFPPSPSQGPDVPVLVLGGREDLRTPLEDQRRAAAQFPRARVLAVPNTGHAVLGSDLSGCASSAVRAFLAGVRFGSCARRPQDVPLALPVFRTLADVPGAVGRVPAVVERTAVAVDVTLRDAYRELAAAGVGSTGGRVTEEAITVGGLRGGRLVVGARSVRLDRYEVVRGVRVSGRLRERGTSTLTVTGAGADGVLLLARSGSFRGTLGGVTIRYRPLPVETG
jgi:pimeloyl-ACP methyl ester carboxylesterase